MMVRRTHRLGAFAAFCLAFCAAGLAIPSAALAQTDACASAPLVTVPTTFSATTTSATADGADSCFPQCSTPDVWVKFTPAADQLFQATTCGGANWDTLLSVHTGCPGNAANQVACNDDACAQRSTIRVNVSAGATYYLRISGWCGDTGTTTIALTYEVPPPPPNEGPDVIVGDITNTARYTPVGAITAYSFGATSCNIGTELVLWQQPTPFHPVIHQAIYRLRNGRMEQLGHSWLKHTFGTIDDGICGPCDGNLGQVLGVGCSDPYVASQAGDRNLLGPTWEVNATTGVFPYPFTSPAWSGSIARRLQVLTSEIDPAQNSGALYFAEVHYVTADDAQAGNGLNNASYHRITFSSSTATPALSGTVFRQQPAIKAWKAADPSVSEVNADYLDGGITARFIVAAKATDAGGGNWDYEYAVFNLNSHRSGQAFSVPLPPGATATNIGFRDVAYHSGDGPGSVNFAGTDWVTSTSGNQMAWATQTFAQNQSANALRWGTTYNFRFRSNRAPTTGNASITLFRPGAGGDPSAVSVVGVPIPSGTICPADFNHDGAVTSQDIFDFLAAFFGNLQTADFNGDTAVTAQDIFDFLAAFFTPCGG